MYFFNYFFTVHNCISLQYTRTRNGAHHWTRKGGFGIEIVKATKEMKSRKSFTKPGKKHAIWKEKKVEFVGSLFTLGMGSGCVSCGYLLLNTYTRLVLVSGDFFNVFHNWQVLVLGTS